MKKELQDKAVELRQQGYSVKQIEKELNVARSSVSRWVKDVELTEENKNKLLLNSKLNALRSAKASMFSSKVRQENNKSIGFKRALNDDKFKVICALYWGEGYKNRPDIQITNTDPKLINLFLDWGIKEKLDFSLTISYYEENSLTYEEIQNWWLEQVPNLTIVSLNKPSICKINRASQNKNIGKLPYGTATLRLKKGTNLFWQIMGGIEYLKSYT